MDHWIYLSCAKKVGIPLSINCKQGHRIKIFWWCKPYLKSHTNWLNSWLVAKVAVAVIHAIAIIDLLILSKKFTLFHFSNQKKIRIFCWKLITEMVVCYQNCSDLLWEKIVLVIEKNFWNSRLRPRICKIFETRRKKR